MFKPNVRITTTKNKKYKILFFYKSGSFLGGNYCNSLVASESQFRPLPQQGHSFRENQCAKKVMSDSPGLVDFAIGLVNSVFNLPNRQVIFF